MITMKRSLMMQLQLLLKRNLLKKTNLKKKLMMITKQLIWRQKSQNRTLKTKKAKMKKKLKF